MIHRVGITNLDANGLSHNQSPLDEDLIGARWHEDCNREAVPSWHVAAYLTLFFGIVVEVPIRGSDDETDQPKGIVDIWEDLHVLHKLQHRTFSLSILAMVRDWIGHQITRYCWENGLLF